jgi:predicted enzyme related to lactoylglutathione lyase
MKRLLITLLLAVVLASCSQTNEKSDKVDAQDKGATEMAAKNDTTPKVTGIGGIFFFTDDQDTIKQWYAENLGLEYTEWGTSNFQSRDLGNPERINTLVWSPFKKGDEYFAPSTKEYMINYTVQNIEGLVAQLKENGVTIVDSIVTYDYGKFVHIMDPEGNKIELWEPSE